MVTVFTLAGIAFLIALDQIIKHWAIGALATGTSVSVFGSFVQLIYVENPGAAFGIFKDKQIFLVVFTGLVILAGFIYLLWKKPPLLLRWAIALCIAGGIGNLIDRVMRNFVVDYIYVDLFNFPVFNFADCCVVIGACLFFLYIIFFERTAKKKQGGEGQPKEAPGKEA